MGSQESSIGRRDLVKATVPFAIAGLAGCTGDGGNGQSDGDGGNGQSDTYDWSLGTSSEGTATHAAGVGFSNIMRQESDFIKMSAQTTGGTEVNPRLIDEGQIDIGLTTGDAISRANTGGSPYDDPRVEKTYCQTFTFLTVNQFLVKRNASELSDIETLDDIPTDQSIAMSWGERGGSGYRVQQLAFEIAGIDNPTDKYDVKTISVGDLPAAMREERLDLCLAYSINYSIHPGWLQELDSTLDVSVVKYPFDEQAVEDSGQPVVYADTEPVFEQGVDADSYPTLSLTYTPTIPGDIPAEAGHEFTRVLMENQESVQETHAVLSEFGPESGTDQLLATEDTPIHPGAEEYYRENDLWSDDFTTLEDYQG